MKDIKSPPAGRGVTAKTPAARTPADRDAVESAADLLDAVSAVRRAARRAVRRSWQTEPLPMAQGELLRLAARTPGLSVAGAAAELRLAPNTVSTLIGKLTDQGLIKRVPSSTDGRSVLLDVTPRARARLAEWRDLRAELTGPVLAGLSGEDQAALAAAIPALRRLAGQMEARQR